MAGSAGAQLRVLSKTGPEFDVGGSEESTQQLWVPSAGGASRGWRGRQGSELADVSLVFVGGSAHKDGPDPGGFALPLVKGAISGADDGTRTRDPHLGNSMADVSCVFAGLSSVAELHVLGDLVSRVSVDRWSRLHFVGDFVGVRRVRFCCRARYVMSIASAGFLPPFLKLLEDIRVTEWLRPRRTLVPSDLPHCGHAVSGGRP
jgi:hypothetical protein